MRGSPSCSVRTTSRCPTNATFGPPLPRLSGTTSESPKRRIGAASFAPQSRSLSASANAFSSPMGEGILHIHKSDSASVISDRNVELAERAVQAGLLIGAFLALSDHQRAGNHEFAGRELLRPHSRNHHAPSRYPASNLHGLGTGDVHDRRRRGQRHARTD